MIGSIRFSRDLFEQKIREKDKQQHFWVCFMLILMFCVWFPLALSVMATFFVGYAKEIWDEQYGSGFCWYDMAANGIGIGMGAICVSIIEAFLGLM